MPKKRRATEVVDEEREEMDEKEEVAAQERELQRLRERDGESGRASA